MVEKFEDLHSYFGDYNIVMTDRLCGPNTISEQILIQILITYFLMIFFGW